MEEENPNPSQPTTTTTTLSKSAQKKLIKQQRQAARKAERKAHEKERRRKDLERRRKEWDEKLNSAASEEERLKMIAERKETRKERMGKRAEERGMKAERLRRAKEVGQKVVIDLEFAELMSKNEIHSLVQQIMYCYAVNGRYVSPAHLWLTGCEGEMETQLQRIPGFDKWIIEKENESYIEALKDQKENLVYLTADAETVLDDLDPTQVYIIGGLVDRNRWKGITMKKANEQGIKSAKLPIAEYLRMSSSQVLTVNQVMEILLKYLETKDWRDAFFQVIPPRKRGGEECEAEAERDQVSEDPAEIVNTDGYELEGEDAKDDDEEVQEEEEEESDGNAKKRQRIKDTEDEVAGVEGDKEKKSIELTTNGSMNNS